MVRTVATIVFLIGSLVMFATSIALVWTHPFAPALAISGVAIFMAVAADLKWGGS